MDFPGNSRQRKITTSQTPKHHKYVNQVHRFMQKHHPQQIKRNLTSPYNDLSLSSSVLDAYPSSNNLFIHLKCWKEEDFQTLKKESSPKKSYLVSGSPVQKIDSSTYNIHSSSLLKQKSADYFKLDSPKGKEYFLDKVFTPMEKKLKNQHSHERAIKTEGDEKTFEDSQEVDDEINAQLWSEANSKNVDLKLTRSLLTEKLAVNKTKVLSQNRHHQNSSSSKAFKANSPKNAIAVKVNELRAEPLDLPEKLDSPKYEYLLARLGNHQESSNRGVKESKTVQEKPDVAKSDQKISNQRIRVEELERQNEVDRKVIKDLQQEVLTLKVHLQTPPNVSKHDTPKGFLEIQEGSTIPASKNNVDKDSLEKEIQFLKAQNQMMAISIETLRSENLTLKQSNQYLLQYKEAARRYRDLAREKQEECAILTNKILSLRPTNDSRLIKSNSNPTPTLSKNKSESPLLKTSPNSYNLINPEFSLTKDMTKTNGGDIIISEIFGDQNPGNEKIRFPEKLDINPLNTKTFQIHV